MYSLASLQPSAVWGNFIRDEMVTGGSGGLAGGTGEAGVAGKGGIVIVERQQG